MEELCISGEPLVLVAPGEGQRNASSTRQVAQHAADRTFARNLDAVGQSTRTPVRSMLCVPALLHRDAVEEVLGDSVGTYLSAARIEGDPDPLVPCLLQVTELTLTLTLILTLNLTLTLTRTLTLTLTLTLTRTLLP